MNKQIALIIEQMKYLRELGLDTSDASMFWSKLSIYEDDYTLFYIDKDDDMDKKTDFYAYTLQDIIEKLPESIQTEDRNYNCILDKRNMLCYADSSVAPVDLDEDTMLHYEWLGDGLLLAAYNMLCWCITNGYVKTNKK